MLNTTSITFLMINSLILRMCSCWAEGNKMKSPNKCGPILILMLYPQKRSKAERFTWLDNYRVDNWPSSSFPKTLMESIYFGVPWEDFTNFTICFNSPLQSIFFLCKRNLSQYLLNKLTLKTYGEQWQPNYLHSIVTSHKLHSKIYRII